MIAHQEGDAFIVWDEDDPIFEDDDYTLLFDFVAMDLDRLLPLEKIHPLLPYLPEMSRGELGELQLKAKAYIYWVLDISTYHLRDLGKDVRERLFSRLYDGIEGTLAMTVSWRDQHEKEIPWITDDEVPEDLKEWLDDQIGMGGGAYVEYEVKSLSDLFLVQLQALYRSDKHVRKCKNCGRYFLTYRPNIDFCNRVIEGETKPCTILGPARYPQRVKENDRALAMKNKYYKRLYARMHRGTLQPEVVEKWKAQAEEKLKEVREGGSIESFEKWLMESTDI